MLTTQLLPRVRSAMLVVRPNVSRSLADRLLAGPLTVFFALFTLFILATWVPGYLTWPMWADQDVFATLAREWSAGRLPYRDMPTTNFPGPIYQAWLFGHLFGWGNARVFWAFDAALVITVAGSCVVWSRVRLGWFLPGTFAAAALVSYSATHDFALAAQRDWQAAAFVLFGILAVSGREKPRWSLLFAAACCAVALTFRPQTVLLMPAVVAAVWASAGWRRTLVGIAGTVALAALLLVPIFANNLVGDWLRELGRIGEGGIYRHHGVDRPEIYQEQALTGGFLVVVALHLFAWVRGYAVPRAAWLWPTFALVGAWFYKPLSPFPHKYIGQPFEVLLIVSGMVVLAAVLRSSLSSWLRLLAVVAVTAGAVHWLPSFCEFTHFGRTWRALNGHPSESYVPKGYTRRLAANQFVYPWACYRRTVDWLKANTTPDTPVANLLLSAAAINGAAGRPTPLHAESMMWVIIVGREDLQQFANEIEASPTALVVWRPEEWEEVQEWDFLPRMIFDRYEKVAAFDEIEVWRRKATGSRSD